MIHPAESDHLPTHVVACGERYTSLFKRIDKMERRLWQAAIAIVLLLLGILVRSFYGGVGA